MVVHSTIVILLYQIAVTNTRYITEFLAQSSSHYLCLGTFEVLGSQGDAVGNALHLLCAQATGGDGGGADANAAGNGGLLRIVGDGVLVAGDLNGVQTALNRLKIPYTGPGAMSSRIAMDKVKTKMVLEMKGVPTPAWSLASPGTAASPIALPVVVKTLVLKQ